MLKFLRFKKRPPQPTQTGPLQPIDRWRQDQGDETLRLNYPLNKKSIVFDLGGYQGDWADKIHSRYGCQVHVFEPIKDFFDKIQSRFAGNEKLSLHPFGLGGKNETVIASFNKDSSSRFRQAEETREMQLKAASSFLADFDKIDLMKVNIEGGEFDLLIHLLDEGLIHKIIDLQVQFHRDIPNAEALRTLIRERLSKTHKLTYDYSFVWENWHLTSCTSS